MDSSTKNGEDHCSWLTKLVKASSEGDIDSLGEAFSHLLAPALYTAVETGQVVPVAYLLDRGAAVNEGLVLLATESRSREILQLLFEHGWDINTPIDFLRPPALAYTFKDPALTEWFLDHGANPNASCGRDCTPLSWAVREAPFSCIQMLFDRGGSSQYGQLLHHAAERELPDRCEVVNYLLEKGCMTSINKIMYQDILSDYLQNMYSGIGSPLHLAAGKGLLDLVQLFVEKGADPLLKDPSGQTPLDRARQGGHTKVMEFLRPLSTKSPVPRHDFVDGPGLHFKPMPMEDFLQMGEWKGVFHV